MKATNVYLNVKKQLDTENSVKFSQTIQILGAAIDSRQTVFYAWIDKNDIQSEDNKTHISTYNFDSKLSQEIGSTSFQQTCYQFV